MKLDEVKKLHQKKYRNQHQCYLVEGEHLVLELDKAMSDNELANAVTLYITEDNQDFVKGLNSKFKTVVLNQKQMANISDTKTPQGIIAMVPMSSQVNVSQKNTATTNSQPPKYIYLHEIQDPGNLGTIIRTLAWFGNFTLLLSPNSVDPFNSKVVRASMGAIFHLPIELEVELSSLLTRFNNCAYLDLAGDSITSPEFKAFDCYLFGNEARGIPSSICSLDSTSAFTIEGSGKIDSLNLSSAVNICAFAISS